MSDRLRIIIKKFLESYNLLRDQEKKDLISDQSFRTGSFHSRRQLSYYYYTQEEV